MKTISGYTAFFLTLIALFAGNAYWNYYVCKQKFPHVAWYVCAFSK